MSCFWTYLTPEKYDSIKRVEMQVHRIRKTEDKKENGSCCLQGFGFLRQIIYLSPLIGRLTDDLSILGNEYRFRLSENRLDFRKECLIQGIGL